MHGCVPAAEYWVNGDPRAVLDDLRFLQGLARCRVALLPEKLPEGAADLSVAGKVDVCGASFTPYPSFYPESAAIFWDTLSPRWQARLLIDRGNGQGYVAAEPGTAAQIARGLRLLHALQVRRAWARDRESEAGPAVFARAAAPRRAQRRLSSRPAAPACAPRRPPTPPRPLARRGGNPSALTAISTTRGARLSPSGILKSS